MDTRKASKPPPAELRARLLEALPRLYMGPSSFMQAFAEAPLQAIAVLKAKPEMFGPLRNYVGPISLKANHQAVVRLARRLHLTD